MIGSAKSKEDVPFETSIPEGAVPLESILRTEELQRRPSRPPDYGKENRALVALAIALADSPRTILQTLAEKVLEVLQADSAGLSLLTKDEKRFYWAAIAGAWQPHLGGGTPRDFGPCGDVLDRNIPMLFTHWERRYPYLCPATPLAEEGLLVPFYAQGKAVGTIWAIAHTEHRKFDTEDLRLLESLGRFASAAYQARASIDDLTLQIAEREKAEAAVRELAHGLEAKLRRLVDSNIIGIFIWSLDGRIIDANDAFLRMVGYDRDDLISGRVRWRELTPAEYRDADDRRVAQLKATGSAQPYEKEYFHQSGRRVPVLVGSALFEESKDEGVAFVLDLSEQKRSEQALRQSEERYRTLAETATDVILTIDQTSTILFVNGAVEKAFGYTPAEIVGRKITALMPERMRYRHEQAMRRYLETGEKQMSWNAVSLLGLHKNGREIDLDVSFAEVGTGDERFFSGIVRDVTERRRAEAALHQAQMELAHVTRVATLGELTASIAHEINQPLGAVINNASACVRWLAAQNLEEARRSAALVVADGQRTADIIGRIRALARKAPFQKDWLDLNTVIRDVISLARSEVQRHSVAVETQLEAEMPRIRGDRIQLQQVLLNLIMNAIEAMRSVGAGPRALRVSSERGASTEVVITVRDSGPGLDPTSLDRLFDAFYTTKPDGLGMGLAISRSIVESHGGRLWATANVPTGATFQFTLPVGSEG